MDNKFNTNVTDKIERIGNTRFVGLDYLKMISILMVITFHYIWNSGFDFNDFCGKQRMVIDIIYMFGEIGVDCFAICTGYLYGKKVNIIGGHGKKILNTWLKVLFYSIVMSAITYVCVAPYDINFKKIWTILTPISSGTWWYTSAYMIIFLCLPLVEKLFANLTEKEGRLLLAFLLGYYCIMATVVGTINGDTETIYGYNRVIFLFIMVCVGAYWYRFKDEVKLCGNLKFWKILLLFTWIFLLIWFYVFEKNQQLCTDTLNARIFWPPNSIPTVMISISIFAIFINLKCKEFKLVKLISASTLGIYQVHGGISKGLWWNRIFHVNITPGTWAFLIEILEAIIVIVCAGIVMEFIWNRLQIIARVISHREEK